MVEETKIIWEKKCVFKYTFLSIYFGMYNASVHKVFKHFFSFLCVSLKFSISNNNNYNQFTSPNYCLDNTCFFRIIFLKISKYCITREKYIIYICGIWSVHKSIYIIINVIVCKIIFLYPLPPFCLKSVEKFHMCQGSITSYCIHVGIYF